MLLYLSLISRTPWSKPGYVFLEQNRLWEKAFCSEEDTGIERIIGYAKDDLSNIGIKAPEGFGNGSHFLPGCTVRPKTEWLSDYKNSEVFVKTVEILNSGNNTIYLERIYYILKSGKLAPFKYKYRFQNGNSHSVIFVRGLELAHSELGSMDANMCGYSPINLGLAIFLEEITEAHSILGCFILEDMHNILSETQHGANYHFTPDIINGEIANRSVRYAIERLATLGIEISGAKGELSHNLIERIGAVLGNIFISVHCPAWDRITSFIIDKASGVNRSDLKWDGECSSEDVLAFSRVPFVVDIDRKYNDRRVFCPTYLESEAELLNELNATDIDITFSVSPDHVPSWEGIAIVEMRCLHNRFLNLYAPHRDHHYEYELTVLYEMVSGCAVAILSESGIDSYPEDDSVLVRVVKTFDDEVSIDVVDEKGEVISGVILDLAWYSFISRSVVAL